MLKVRVIPTLLWKDVSLVKGIGFNSWRRVGTVLPALKVYNGREVDELILLDISATLERRHPDYATLEDLSAECFVPLTVGGGVDGIEAVRSLLKAGADKVCINSAAYERPELITESASRFGSQCIVAGIDARRLADGRYRCYSHAGTVEQPWSPADWAKEAEALGAGEILLTSVERDGTMNGYDVELIRSVTQSVSIPVIASGGAGSFEDFFEAIVSGGAQAAAAASLFHFTQATPLEVKQHLASRGIKVRNSNQAMNAQAPYRLEKPVGLT